MRIFRFVGLFLTILAMAALGFEFTQALITQDWNILTLGELWFKIDPQSINISQAGIQRHLAPWLWEPVITSILLCPCWVIFGSLGFWFIWIGRRKLRQKRWFR